MVALLVREERARVAAESGLSERRRVEQLKRLDGVATLLARTAARDASPLALLAEDARVSDAARALKAATVRPGGIAPPEEEPEPAEPVAPPAPGTKVSTSDRSATPSRCAISCSMSPAHTSKAAPDDVRNGL